MRFSGLIFIFVSLLYSGAQVLAAESSSKGDPISPGAAIRGILLHQLRTQPAHERDWNWEDAIYLHALSRVGEMTPDEEVRAHIISTLSEYADHWTFAGVPEITMGDKCPPVLAILGLDRLLKAQGGEIRPEHRHLLEPVRRYLKYFPRNKLGAIDHLGYSWFRLFYPDSMWVDSLIMTGVTSLRLGLYLNDPELLEFGARQPAIYSSVLEDPAFHLFRHSWLVEWERPNPKSETFWLRGNAWVVWALVESLELLPIEHPAAAEMRRILLDISSALLKLQKRDGLWGTVANLPEYADEETSGSAIIGAQWLRAVRLGLLPAQGFRAAGLNVWRGVSGRLKPNKGGFSVLGISGPTNPGGRLNYKWVGEKRDAGYGVGPVLLLAEEVRAISSNRGGMHP